MLHKILIWLIGLVLLGVASLIINLILVVLKVGNIKRVLFLRKVKNLLSELPSELLLACTDQKVAALTFDASSNREKAVPLYTGLLTWHGAARPVSDVLGSARRQFAVRSSVFIFVFIPLMAVSVWLTVFVDWRVIGAVILLIFHQFYPFYIWKYPAFSELL